MNSKKKVRKDDIFLIWFIVIMGFIIISDYIFKNNSDRSLRHNYTYHTAIIHSIKKLPKGGGHHLYYNYYIENISYTGFCFISLNNKNKNKFKRLIGESWPIVYDTMNYSNSKILLNRKDYKGFKLYNKQYKYINF